MNIGPGNIEALLLDALEGRLSADEAAKVWAALEAHPEWGVCWDFEDRELPRLQAEDGPTMDWSGLKKEVVTDQQIRQSLRQDRDRHTLDARVQQSLYRQNERSLWRYWAAAASVALLAWFAWPAGDHSAVTSMAGVAPVAANTSSIIPPTPASPPQVLADAPPSTALGDQTSTSLGDRPLAAQRDRIINEHCNGTPEQIQEGVIDKVLPLSEEEWLAAQGIDTTSLEAPLELPFELIPTQHMAEVEAAPRLRSGTEERTYTPLEWLKMKAVQIAARKEADGTLPTVRRDKQSFDLQWGSLSINAH